MGSFEEYVIGSSPMPWWLRGRLMQYKTMSGDTGFEFTYRRSGVTRVVQLERGDVLLRYGGTIYIQRKENEA